MAELDAERASLEAAMNPQDGDQDEVTNDRKRQAGGAKSDADESQGICDPRTVVPVGLAGRHWPGHLARSQGNGTQAATSQLPAAFTIART